MIRPSPVFSRLHAGNNVYGLLNSLPSPMLCEMLAFAGYDFAILDLEHLLRSEEDIMPGVDALGEMLQMPGVGMIMEGALDLALDLDLRPDPLTPQVWQTLQKMADACLNAAIPFCANPRTAEQTTLWRARGIRSFLAGEDRGLLHNALKARLHSLQQ